MVVTLPQIEVFVLVLSRIAGIFIQAPVYNSRTFPALGKTALAIWISAVMLMVVPVKALPDSSFTFMIMIASELIIGFLIGFVCQILFTGIQAAGDLIDLQMGTSIANSLDPNTGSVSSMVGKLTFFIGTVTFLILNGHHMILAGVHQSFNAIPVGYLINISPNLTTQLIELVGVMLLIAVQLAVPALLMIFLSDFSFGIVSRVAPQVNVFMLGFQIKPSLGMLAILFSIPLIANHIGTLTNQMIQEIVKLFVTIR